MDKRMFESVKPKAKVPKSKIMDGALSIPIIPSVEPLELKGSGIKLKGVENTNENPMLSTFKSISVTLAPESEIKPKSQSFFNQY